MREALLSLLLTLLTPISHRVAADVPYAEGPRRALDVYAPAKARGAPVVVFFYGGSWDSGEKGFYRFVGSVLARRGIVTVIPDYRVYPAVGYEGILQDCAQATAWAKANVGRYGGDPGRLVLMGHSAGAYNAAMLAVDDRWLNAVGMDAGRDVRALVGLSGPYDFLPLRSETLKAVFGPEGSLAQTQPVNHVNGNEPPALLLHGGADTVVWPRNAERLAERLQAHGRQAEVKVYPGVGHARLIGAFAPALKGDIPALADSLAFIRAHAGATAP